MNRPLRFGWGLVCAISVLAAPAELLSNLVFQILSGGGVLLNSVDKFLSFQEEGELLVAVEVAPAFLGGLGQFEHHR